MGQALDTDLARHIWETRYRFVTNGGAGDQDIGGTWSRVALALSSAEASHPDAWAVRFRGALDGFRFLPGGRIVAGAGTDHRATLSNCFVLGTLEGGIPGIYETLRDGAITMQHGGGIGCDFSAVTPRGVRDAGASASGVVAFLRVWDAMCETVRSSGERRGAMMATLRADHPDVEDFVTVKRSGGLHNFNLSVLVSDALLEAADADGPWSLRFRSSTGEERVERTISARGLWQKITRSAYESSEPGVLFVDRINTQNNLYYCEDIGATNPCGEVPLPPYGSCNLGSVNLTQFVKNRFEADARFDIDAMREVVNVAVRMLDDVIDVSRFPLPWQREAARSTRRVGLGVTAMVFIPAM